jgi:hypothetical protein
MGGEATYSFELTTQEHPLGVLGLRTSTPVSTLSSSSARGAAHRASLGRHSDTRETVCQHVFERTRATGVAIYVLRGRNVRQDAAQLC